MKITEYPAATSLLPADVAIVDGVNGTKKVSVQTLFFETLESLASPMIHRAYPRGKNLGTTLTAGQKSAIADGTFKDLWINDYWLINGITWRIVDLNYWLTGSFTTNHVVVMPDAALFKAKMHGTASTAGGYVGSLMHTTNITPALTTAETAFGAANILGHPAEFTSAFTNPNSTGYTGLTGVKIELPSERMLFGERIRGAGFDTVWSSYTRGAIQLSLFKQIGFVAHQGENLWSREISNSSAYVNVGTNDAGITNADQSMGVRPVFAIA